MKQKIVLIAFVGLIFSFCAGFGKGGPHIDIQWIPNKWAYNENTLIVKVYVDYSPGVGISDSFKVWFQGRLKGTPFEIFSFDFVSDTIEDEAVWFHRKTYELKSTQRPTPGKYIVQAKLRLKSEDEIREGDEKEIQVESPGQPTTETLIPWAGDGQYGDPYNTNIALEYPYAIPIMVRLIDSTGAGINGKQISYSTNYMGSLLWTSSYTGDVQGETGITYNILKINSGYSDNYIVYAKYGTPQGDTIETSFNLRAFEDKDTSFANSYPQWGYNPHRRKFYPGGPEIPGDGFKDTDFYADSTPWKDIYIEIDIDQRFLTDIDTNLLKFYVKDILETATNDPNEGYGLSGLEVHIKPVQVISNLPDSLSFEQMKSYLRQYRNFRNAIHVILGTKKMRNTYYPTPPNVKVFGYTVDLWQYLITPPESLGMGYSHRKALRYVEHYSSGPDRQEYLDAVGVWVFVRSIIEEIYDLNQLNGTVSLITAHEIGHALGMDHVTADTNLMVREFTIDTPTFDYSDYAFFLLWSLDDCDDNLNDQQHWSISTTDILGRDNASPGLKALGFAYFPFLVEKGESNYGKKHISR